MILKNDLEMAKRKKEDLDIFQLVSNNVWVDFKKKSEFQQIIKVLQETGFLGENIVVGTYYPHNFSVEDIDDLYEYRSKYSKNPIVGIAITHEEEYQIKKYPKCFSKGNILVSLVTKEDVKDGDVPKIKLKKQHFI